MSRIIHQVLENNIHSVQLNSGRGNPITAEIISDLHRLFNDIKDENVGALLLGSTSESIFSGGFNLPTIAYYNREQLSDFFNGYLDMVYSLMRLPFPTISVINGHTIAAGFILSLATDFRICEDKKFKLGLSEVDLGVAVPAGAQVLFESRTSRQSALYYSSSATLFSAKTAHAIGYAQDLCESAQSSAMDLANHFARKPAFGAGLTCTMSANRIISEMVMADNVGMPLFLDSWFDSQSQELLQAMAKKLSGK